MSLFSSSIPTAGSASHALSTYLPPGPLPAPCAADLRRGKRLRLFVYPLPWDYHGKIVGYVESQAKRLLGVKCSYLREDTCPNTGFSHLENLRSHCTDVPLMAKLLQAATIVTDPEQAQVFLVPFLMGCNAMLGWGHGMQRVNAAAHHRFFGDFDRFARESLPHFERWPHRHLFLFPLDSMFSPKWLKRSMVAHTGAGYVAKSSIDVPVPYLVSLPPVPAGALSGPRERLVFPAVDGTSGLPFELFCSPNNPGADAVGSLLQRGAPRLPTQICAARAACHASVNPCVSSFGLIAQVPRASRSLRSRPRGSVRRRRRSRA